MPGFTDEEWEKAAGDECPRCHQTTLRIRPRDRVCLGCASLLDRKAERDEDKRTRILESMKRHNKRVSRLTTKTQAPVS